MKRLLDAWCDMLVAGLNNIASVLNGHEWEAYWRGYADGYRDADV